jgi:curved DNA-binding protein CbpA
MPFRAAAVSPRDPCLCSLLRTSSLPHPTHFRSRRPSIANAYVYIHLPHHTPSAGRAFYASALLRASSTPSSHYETLGISSTATASEIKRQYFSLSKQCHPDRNPDDPTASTRFVEVSEAYHVLSVPDKRAAYDHQLQEASGRRPRAPHGGHAPSHGSYSSHQSFAGSRPATGLNKKRGTFRGPPPSFYKSGGYGRHGAKRAEYAHYNPHTGAETSGSQETGSEGDFQGFGAGFGPGQTAHGTSVPHFDDIRHKRTQHNVHEHIHSRKRSKVRPTEEPVHRTPLNAFLWIAGSIATIGFVANLMHEYNESDKKRRDSSR